MTCGASQKTSKDLKLQVLTNEGRKAQYKLVFSPRLCINCPVMQFISLQYDDPEIPSCLPIMVHTTQQSSWKEFLHQFSILAYIIPVYSCFTVVHSLLWQSTYFA